MFMLNRRPRSTLAALGAALVCFGLALVPLYGRPATDSALRSSFASHSAAAALLREQVAALPAVTDPFALPWEDAPSVPAHGNMRRSVKRHQPTVRAIVTGARPMALLSFDDGSTRIVAPGDAIDASRVARIEANAVVLFDGQHLRFSEELR